MQNSKYQSLSLGIIKDELWFIKHACNIQVIHLTKCITNEAINGLMYANCNHGDDQLSRLISSVNYRAWETYVLGSNWSIFYVVDLLQCPIIYENKQNKKETYSSKRWSIKKREKGRTLTDNVSRFFFFPDYP